MENKIRINFKGGSLTGKSTEICEKYIVLGNELYKLETKNSGANPFVYKYKGNIFLISTGNIQM